MKKSRNKNYYIIANRKRVILKRKYPIILDIGLAVIFIGFLIWSLVAFGILGQNKDIFSNSFFSIGGIIVCIGGIFIGIGGILMYFKP